MTFYHVAVHHLVHTCPANRDTHVWATTREVIGIMDGGTCQKPQTIAGTVIACSRKLPAHKQCPACKVTIVESSVTVTETGAIK